jgi:hypothetical protein
MVASETILQFRIGGGGTVCLEKSSMVLAYWTMEVDDLGMGTI